MQQRCSGRHVQINSSVKAGDRKRCRRRGSSAFLRYRAVCTTYLCHAMRRGAARRRGDMSSVPNTCQGIQRELLSVCYEALLQQED